MSDNQTQKTQRTLQDQFLNDVRKREDRVTIIMMNGYQLNNVKLIGFDSFALMVESEEKQMLIYKHAISTISVKERHKDDSIQ